MITWLEQHLFRCTLKSNFGIDCPGCGIQRAFIELLKGNFEKSLTHNVALIPLIFTVFLLIVQLIKKYNNGGVWVMWLFIITSVLTLVQYTFKQILFFY